MFCGFLGLLNYVLCGHGALLFNFSLERNQEKVFNLAIFIQFQALK